MSWWTPTTPDKIEARPWLSPAATAYLESLLKPDMKVLEHGCGGSTLWFAERVQTVDSVENNPKWLNAVKAQAPANVTLWQILPPQVPFDLLLIDGEPVEDRALWIMDVDCLVKPGGAVVLDNANRPEYRKERTWLQEHCESLLTIDGNEHGTQYLVTEFYTLKGG